jgi:hypothetical protein
VGAPLYDIVYHCERVAITSVEQEGNPAQVASPV